MAEVSSNGSRAPSSRLEALRARQNQLRRNGEQKIAESRNRVASSSSEDGIRDDHSKRSVDSNEGSISDASSRTMSRLEALRARQNQLRATSQQKIAKSRGHFSHPAATEQRELLPEDREPCLMSVVEAPSGLSSTPTDSPSRYRHSTLTEENQTLKQLVRDLQIEKNKLRQELVETWGEVQTIRKTLQLNDRLKDGSVKERIEDLESENAALRKQSRKLLRQQPVRHSSLLSPSGQLTLEQQLDASRRLNEHLNQLIKEQHEQMKALEHQILSKSSEDQEKGEPLSSSKELEDLKKECARLVLEKEALQNTDVDSNMLEQLQLRNMNLSCEVEQLQSKIDELEDVNRDYLEQLRAFEKESLPGSKSDSSSREAQLQKKLALCTKKLEIISTGLLDLQQDLQSDSADVYVKLTGIVDNEGTLELVDEGSAASPKSMPGSEWTQAELERLRAENKSLTMQIEKLEAKIKELESQSKADVNRQMLVERYNEMKGPLFSFSNTLEEMKKSNKRLTDKVADLESQLQSEKNEKQNLKQNMENDGQLELVSSQLAESDARVLTLEAEVYELKKELEAAKERSQ